MGISLEDIFSDSKSEPQIAPAEKAEAVEAVEAPEKSANEAEAVEMKEQGETPDTSDADKASADVQANEGAPPAPAKDESSPTVPRKALEDERRKRQDEKKRAEALEARLAEMEKRLMTPPQAVQQQQPQQPRMPAQQPRPQLPPDPWEDPQGAIAFAERRARQDIITTKVALSQDMMRSTKPDYDAVEAVFVEECERDPSLAVRMAQSPNPAKFAYEMGNKLRLMREIGDDPSAYETKLRAKWEAELQAKAEEDANQIVSPVPPQTVAPTPPSSLAGVPSVASRSKPKWSGPTPLEDILK